MKREKLIITGHRGAAGLAPENTLASIQLALELGVDRIEIDVQQTKDNKIIVLHDRTLRRTTTGNGFVKKLTYDEILQFSAGFKFNKFYSNEKVPTLEQVIDLIDGKVELLIETKYSYMYYPNIERHLINIIKNKNAKDWCKIISFNDRALFRINKLDSSIKLGKLFVGKHAHLPLSFDKGINIRPLKKYAFVDEVIVKHDYATRAIIDKVHDFGKELHVWTVNHEATIQKLIERGVDGIISDYPNLVMKYRK
ncbi:MAG TPA: glycerophosphodiester phosphodiesterase family protein [Vicingaceae bacterium]|nr:glycerophosphodiester phosphodiesterase family protein [Vicingaceae bacterium]